MRQGTQDRVSDMSYRKGRKETGYEWDASEKQVG